MKNRRTFLKSSAVGLTGSTLLGAGASANGGAPAVQTALSGVAMAEPKLRFCLNTSTINGGKVPVREQVQIAAKAGYDAVELWLRDIDRHVTDGGTLSDLGKEISDLGLGVDSAIAFANWIVDDEATRNQGLEQSKRDMETLRLIGGKRIAAPPVGATKEITLDLRLAGERYRDLLEVGRMQGVVPQVELWGFSKNLSTLAEVLYVAAAANDPDACVLLDVYHMYKGGNDFTNVGLIPAQKMHCLHMNDYPAEPNREKISDADRVYPGDGIAPLDNILRTIVNGGFQGTLSLELFNRSYWEQPPQDVAKIGLEKMKAAVASALG